MSTSVLFHKHRFVLKLQLFFTETTAGLIYNYFNYRAKARLYHEYRSRLSNLVNFGN